MTVDEFHEEECKLLNDAMDTWGKLLKFYNNQDKYLDRKRENLILVASAGMMGLSAAHREAHHKMQVMKS